MKLALVAFDPKECKHAIGLEYDYDDTGLRHMYPVKGSDEEHNTVFFQYCPYCGETLCKP